MADLDDHIQDQDEMNNVFSRPMGQDAYLNDADLESGRKRSFLFLVLHISIHF